VGYGGPYAVPDDGGFDPGSREVYHITWLPKGFAPTADMRVLCVVAEPPGEDWSAYGFGRGERPPMIEAICQGDYTFCKCIGLCY
jgi:hypothetical protein